MDSGRVDGIITYLGDHWPISLVLLSWIGVILGVMFITGYYSQLLGLNLAGFQRLLYGLFALSILPVITITVIGVPIWEFGVERPEVYTYQRALLVGGAAGFGVLLVPAFIAVIWAALDGAGPEDILSSGGAILLLIGTSEFFLVLPMGVGVAYGLMYLRRRSLNPSKIPDE